MSRVEDRIHRTLAAPGAVDDPSTIAELVRAADPLRSAAAVERSVAAIRSQLGGLGPLDPLLALPDVTDVMVNGPGPVWIERAGTLQPTEVVLSAAQVDLLVERIVAPLGRRADPVHALVDARLADGSRVHVVVPPLAVDGPCITIRRFSVRPVDVAAMAPSTEVADLLRWAVRSRCNLVVSGATGSGKTTLLNALAGELDCIERVITVEDAAELRLSAPHVVRLESRVAVADGGTEVPIRELVRNALRMRPDRLIIGELRGGEAFDLLAAMNTGHDGTLTTIHANSAVDAIGRLETLVLLAGVGLPLDAVRSQLAASLDLVVHVERIAAGGRAVAEVVEVGGLLDDGRVATRRIADRSGVIVAPVRLRGAARGLGPRHPAAGEAA